MSKNTHKIDYLNPKTLNNDCNKIRLLVKEPLNILSEHSAHECLNIYET